MHIYIYILYIYIYISWWKILAHGKWLDQTRKGPVTLPVSLETRSVPATQCEPSHPLKAATV